MLAPLFAALLACRPSAPAAPPDAGTTSGTAPTACTDPAPAVGAALDDPVVAALRCGLDGFDLREGRFDYFTEEDCASLIEDGGGCHGNHAASPYAMMRFDEDTAVGGVLPTYQMDQDEALLFIGRTPPAGRYFSFNNYQYTKAVPEGQLPTFGAFARSANMLTLVTEPSPTAPFDAYTAVVFTANQTTFDRLKAALAPILTANGLSPDVVNLQAIGLADDEDYARLLADPAYGPDAAFQLTMGYGPEADVDAMLFRMAGLEGDDPPYLDPERIPAACFKVRLDDRPAYDPPPFPLLPPDDWTDESEGQALREARATIGHALEAAELDKGLMVDSRAFSNDPQDHSVACLNGEDICNAINDDARYLRSKRYQLPLLDEDQSSVYVVGLVHADVSGSEPEAPPIAYSTLSIMNWTDQAGVLALLDHDLQGSVRDFFPDGVPGVPEALEPLIYVRRFARVCDDNPSCTVIPSEPPIGIDPTDLVWFTERVYLNGTSRTAPHQDSIVEPVIVAASPTIEVKSFDNPARNHLVLR
ncbi:MAG: hypothetical protein R3F59_01225 [Myxococcota bacterium]